MFSLLVSACLSLPTHLHVVDHFRAPSCERCAGNRGLELATTSGGPVEVGLNGVVSFAGVVGGRNYVVVRATANPSLRVTYGRLSAIDVVVGQAVGQGRRLGLAADMLFVGVRIGDHYVDPLRFVSGATHHRSAAIQGRPRYRITLGSQAVARC